MAMAGRQRREYTHVLRLLQLEGEQRQLAKATTGHKKHQDMLHGHEVRCLHASVVYAPLWYSTGSPRLPAHRKSLKRCEGGESNLRGRLQRTLPTPAFSCSRRSSTRHVVEMLGLLSKVLTSTICVQYSELKEQATRSTGEIQAQLDHATRDLASSKNALQRYLHFA